MPALQDRPDTPYASRLVPGLGYRTGALHPRLGPTRSVVVHTTGAGILARFAREGAAKGDATPHDTAVRVYATIMPDSGHYVVGALGECTQVVPEYAVARHVGAAKSRAYYLPRERWLTPAVEWWPVRWPGLASPVELAGGMLWEGGSCNAGAVGIEVVPPLSGARDAWSAECWATLARLVADVCARRHVPLDREHVVTHSDAHPISRSAKGAPWDPPPSQWAWERMRAALASLAPP